MATSSIYANVVLKSNKSAKALVRAFESSNDSEPEEIKSAHPSSLKHVKNVLEKIERNEIRRD